MTISRPPGGTDEPHRHGGESDRPNVVLVVLDTARAKNTVPATPSITPTLASLAETGTEYTRAFASAPWTLPSHASLFTGLYTAAHGSHGGYTYLDDSHETLPEAFQAAGYETVGVSNNCWITGEFGFDRGFDHFRKGWQYIQSDVDTGAIIRAHGLDERLSAFRQQLFEGNPAVTMANVAYERFLCSDDGAKRTTDWITDWLAERAAKDDTVDSQPFFLFCNYIEPHIEYDPPRAYAERFLPAEDVDTARQLRQDPRAFDVGAYDLSDEECELLRGLYKGELAYVDSQLGRLCEGLKQAGEWDNTVLVVLGDHGENIGEYGFFGHQYNLHETVVHVPLLISGGGFTGGGQRDAFVQLLDLVPTLLDETGIDAPVLAEQAQGQSFHPQTTTRPRSAVFAEHIKPQPSVDSLEARFGQLPARVQAFDRSLRSIRTEKATYIEGSDGSRWLYLVADGDEQTNRIDDRPEIASSLSRQLDEWLETVEGEQQARETVEMSASTEQRLADLGYL